MVGGLQAGRRVAAAALLALGSVVPQGGPLLTTTRVAPVVDTSAACAVTVGTATTDPALAVDAARAIAVGYATTDCLPDATLLAAAEARAAIPLGSAATPTASSPLGGSSSSGTVAAATSTITPTANPTPPPSTEASASTETTTGTTTTGTTTDDGTSSGTEGSSDGSDNDGSDNDGSDNGLGDDEPTNDDNAGCVDTGGSATATVAANDTVTSATAAGTVTDATATDATTAGSSTATTGTTTDGTAPTSTTAAGTTTAACTLGWGAATGVEDFDGAGLTNWTVYDGPGHAGNGRRSPSAMSVNGGVLTITGDSNGTTGGMAWKLGRSQYGRWEARVKSPVADPSYNAVVLLWPDAENWPVGGEVDFMEISDETRQEVDFFLHYSAENRQLHSSKQIDATQWHNWAVEWSPTKITGYVDGIEWFSTTQASALPPGPMHLTLQLDWFPKGGSVQRSTMDVDWVRYYPIEGSGTSEIPPTGTGTGSGSGSGTNLITGTGDAQTGGDTNTADTNNDTGTDVLVDGTGDAPVDEELSTPTGTTANATTTVEEPAQAALGGTADGGADALVGAAATLDGDGSGADTGPASPASEG